MGIPLPCSITSLHIRCKKPLVNRSLAGRSPPRISDAAPSSSLTERNRSMIWGNSLTFSACARPTPQRQVRPGFCHGGIALITAVQTSGAVFSKRSFMGAAANRWGGWLTRAGRPTTVGPKTGRWPGRLTLPGAAWRDYGESAVTIIQLIQSAELPMRITRADWRCSLPTRYALPGRNSESFGFEPPDGAAADPIAVRAKPRRSRRSPLQYLLLWAERQRRHLPIPSSA